MKKKLILASTSPYRAELLRRLQIPFETASPHTNESPYEGEKSTDTAERLSIAKAKSIAQNTPDSFVIGSDQVADLHGKQVGKPGTTSAARDQLRAMRGQSLVFHSGVALINAENGATQSCVVSTTVRFRDYTDTEIEHYLERENALDCAGSAKAEGLGIALIASMQSEDPTALIGLPLIALSEMLRNEGIGVLA